MELILDPNSKGGKGILVTKDEQEVGLSRTETIYMAILIEDGYVTVEELYNSVHGGVGCSELPYFNIGRIRKKIGKDAIKSKKVPGGYYIGELSAHRNEEKYLKRYDGFVLNTLIRCVKLQNEDIAYLTETQTYIMELLINLKGKTHNIDLDDDICRLVGSYKSRGLQRQVYGINKALGGEFIVATDGFYRLTNEK
ncbi:MAG: hypothetical protein AABX34_04915 [Nanoarchaeota archaeon]